MPRIEKFLEAPQPFVCLGVSLILVTLTRDKTKILGWLFLSKSYQKQSVFIKNNIRGAF